jgi:hypothetical protein
VDTPENEVEAGEQPDKKITMWDLPPTWFGYGVGMVVGAGLAGGHPWYRPALVGLAGLLVAVAMLVHVRRR